MVRYALYYTPPPGSPLATLGNGWLGRDMATAQDLPQPQVPGLDVAAITAAPRRYGFHATLKAPFELAEERTEVELAEAVAAFAATRAPVTAPPLRLGTIGGFVALVPAAPCPALDALAADVVQAFDPFRALLSDHDRARRNASALSERQQALLDQWGYPYVLDEFRFHMTLTDNLDPATRDRAVAALAPRTAGVTEEPLVIDALSVCLQPARGKPFDVQGRHALSGGDEETLMKISRPGAL